MKKARSWVQIFFFAFIAFIAVNKTLSEVGSAIPILSDASLHALCPFGGVVTLYNLATLGTFIQKIHASSMVLMAIIFFLAVLFGPVFCGWVCPLGTIQEWFGKLGRKLFKRKYNRFVPEKLDKVLRYFRYVVLVWVVFVTARSGYLMFENIDPYNALFSFWSDEVKIPALIILGITLGLSLLVERPWCKYACPYGALLGITNTFRVFKIRREPATCISCNKCSKTCPMNIEVASQEKVTDHQCISCYECTSEASCPVPKTVDMSIQLKSTSKGFLRTIKTRTMAVIILVVIFGSISASIGLDVWATTSSKVPVKYTSGEAEGEYNPIDIRGSYSFEQVADLFDIELEILYRAFLVPEELQSSDFKSKNLESLFEGTGVDIGNESLQVFVALYKNLPIELDESVLPDVAVDIILDHNSLLTEAQKEYLRLHTVTIDAQRIASTISESVVSPETAVSSSEATEGEPIVNGSATFQKVLDAGVTKEQIESIIGDTLPPTNQTVKDYCISKGLSFSSIKEQLNALIP